MARHRRALIRAFVAGALVASSATLIVACVAGSPPPDRPVSPVTSARPAAPDDPPVIVDAGPAAAPRKASQCKPVGPDQISEDDHPQLGGVGEELTLGLGWLEKQGVPRKVAIAWYASKMGMKPDEAEGRLGELACYPAKLGDPSEEGVVCRTFTLVELMPIRAMGIVVRRNQPVALFHVGIQLGAMDFPEAHHLDLALRLAPDGKSFDVYERAKDGTELVMAPSWCQKQERDFGGVTDPSSTTVHDCAGARKVLADMASSGTPGARWQGVLANARSFVARSCNERGRWTWKGGAFALTSKP